MKLLIVGAAGGSNIGGSFFQAAKEDGVDARICDTNEAWRHDTFRQKILWHFAGRRPLRLKSFSQRVLEQCRIWRPDVLLATGRAPITDRTLRACRELNIRCVNYSTDDPFNRRMHSPWFLEGLPQYNVVYTPRRVNLAELREFGCRDVRYLPFGYDAKLFFQDSKRLIPESRDDLFFAGTAERSRLEYVTEAMKAGLRVRLYGSGWRRHWATRAIALGQADIPTIHRGVNECKLALCVVRHDNRDGHSMRTFELAAMGACMLVEDTVEHREIFGDEAERVFYFTNSREMIEKIQFLLRDTSIRSRLRETVHSWITHGSNTYTDRLQSILGRTT